MKTSRMYHYRITAMSGGGGVREPELHDHDRPAPNGLMKPTVTTDDARPRCRAAS